MTKLVNPSPDVPASARWRVGRTPAGIWLLTAAFALLSVIWSLLTPQFLAPDEPEHFSTSYRVSQGFQWPDPGTAYISSAVDAATKESAIPPSARSTLDDLSVQHPGLSGRIDQMTQHPPLYYLLSGGLLAAPGVTSIPWDQSMLLVRVLGAVLAAPLIWLSWNGVATLLRSRRAGIVAASTVFVVPQLPQTMGVVTNDSLAILLAWTTTWLAIKVMDGDRRYVTVVGLGLAFGLGALTKGTVLPLGLLVVLALLVRSGGTASLMRRLRQLAVALTIAFVSGGWWWLRNLIKFGSLQPDGLMLSTRSADPDAPTSLGHYIDTVWNTTPTTFWGSFGRVSVPLPELVVDVLSVVGLIVIVIALLQRGSRYQHILILMAPIALSAILFVRTSWSAYETTGVVRGLHGRYFFTVLLAVIAVSALALASITRNDRSRTAIAIIVAGVSMAMAIGGATVAFLGFYADNRYGAWRDGLENWLTAAPLPPATTASLVVVFLGVYVSGMVMVGSALYRRVQTAADLGAPARPV